MSTIASPPPTVAPLSELALCRWIGTASPGDALVYFRGALARSLCPQLGLLEHDERISLARLAERAWKLADEGLAHLVQRRHGFEDFEYLLIARRRSRRRVSSLLPQILAEAA